MRKKISILYFLLGYLVLSSATTQARSWPAVQRYGIEEGLESLEVFGMKVGPRGQLWVGTGNGLFVFDGHTFRRLGQDKGYVSSFFKFIWDFQGGLLAIGSRPDRLYFIYNEELRYSMPLRQAWGIFRFQGFDRKELRIYAIHGSIWHELDLSTGETTVYRLGRGWSLDRVIFEGGKPKYGFFPNQTGFFGLDAGEFHELPEVEKRWGEPISMNRLSEDSIMLKTSKGIYVLDNELMNGTRLPIEVESSEIINFFGDQKGRVWMYPEYGGLYMWDHVKLHNLEEEVLGESTQVNNIYEDGDGTIWVGTHGRGIFCIPESDFDSWTVEDGMKSGYVTALELGEDGKLFVGSNDGLMLFGESEKEGRMELIEEIRDDRGEYFEYILSLKYHDGEILSHQSGLSITNGKVRNAGLGIRHLLFNSAIVVWDGEIAYGGWGQLALGGTGEYNVRHMEKVTGAKEYGKVFDLGFFRDTLYVAASEGLLRVPGKGRELEWMKDEEVEKKGGWGNCHSLELDAEGNLWVGTNQGLWRRRGEKWEKMEEITETQGKCNALQRDRKGRMWIGTDLGLVMCEAGNWRTFRTSNGLAGNQVLTLRLDGIRDQLWIGTSRGLSGLDLAREFQPRPAKLHLLSVEETGTGRQLKPGGPPLAHDQNSLHIRFSALYLANNTDAEYQYRLVDTDSTWNRSVGNEAWLLSLSPGKHVFEARCRVPESHWSPPTRFEFEILAPYWKRPGFVAGVFGLSILLLALFFFIRSRKVRRREAEKRRFMQRIHGLEHKVLAASLNPHFVFNALNSIQHIFVKHKDHAGIKFASGLARLIRFNMESAHHRYIPLATELERLRLYLELECSRLEGKLEFSFDLPTEISEENPLIPNMIFQPIVENAIWHGIAPAKGAGKITILFEKPGAMELTVTVRDDGVGLGKSAGKDHNSQGLKLIRERLSFYDERNELRLFERGLTLERPGVDAVFSIHLN